MMDTEHALRNQVMELQGQLAKAADIANDAEMRLKEAEGRTLGLNRQLSVKAAGGGGPRVNTWPPEVGFKLRDVDGTLYHVRGMVDDQCVMRWWSRTKRRWRYVVEGPSFFAVRGWSIPGWPKPKEGDDK